MLITPGNFEKYLPTEKYINIPHKQVFFTLIFHEFIIFTALTLFFNVLAIISVIVLIIEGYYICTLLFKMWKKVGYSPKVFIILQCVLFFVNAMLAAILRGYLLNLI